MLKMSDIPYRIGAKYKYVRGRTMVLEKVIDRRFVFKCGHWCTDSVFIDLIDMKEKLQVYQIMHMTIKF